MRKLVGDLVEFFRRATATPEHCAGWKSVSGLRLISARRDRGSDSADRLFSYDPPGAEEMDSPLARSADDESALAFTVVVPTYGRPEGLRSCLESLVAQRYPRSRFEVIVIDDGSAIPAAPIAASFDDRLQVRVRRQANAGPAAARNHGGMSARGSYIAFLDDDCVAEPGWLRGFESAFLAHPRDTLLGGDLANPFTDNVYAEVGELILRVLLACYRPEPGGVYFFRTANLAVRADEFRACGGFDPMFETAEDREQAQKTPASCCQETGEISTLR